jgi:hypothetical protein
MDMCGLFAPDGASGVAGAVGKVATIGPDLRLLIHRVVWNET